MITCSKEEKPGTLLDVHPKRLYHSRERRVYREGLSTIRAGPRFSKTCRDCNGHSCHEAQKVVATGVRHDCRHRETSKKVEDDEAYYHTAFVGLTAHRQGRDLHLILWSDGIEIPYRPQGFNMRRRYVLDNTEGMPEYEIYY